MLLDTTSDDINSLNDTDLRSLVGKLCEAELHLQKLPTTGVTWGGDQNAPDGGIDVRVELSSKVNEDGYIPRSVTGYQVKKPAMSATKIREEMRPNGKLRTVIRELADDKGAYIIISSETVSDSALKNRKKAMFDALSDIENYHDIKLDFYDRNRMATWVNSNPALILWVKEKIGHPIQGWKSFGNWANPKAEINEEYLLDDGTRLHDPNNKNQNGMTVIEGINVLRTRLLNSTTSIRLAGLSGVGKTRLLQALFDERIGNNALPDSQVYYTDISYSPKPLPAAFAEQLLNLNKKAILIVDNCPPDLHKILTTICTRFGSLVKLITVEFDIRDDLPEETDVFRLEPATTTLIEKLIQIRFKHISQVDSHTIAESSGGNARIAIALAQTINVGESLGILKNDELFKRLFNQRNDANDNLMKSAEVCALVYSFDYETDDENSELKKLASLSNLNIDQLFSDISVLEERQLVQKRDIWRAILPHAIANKLADRTLKRIRTSRILDIFEQKGSERLLKSFSKRLSYLHDSEPAKEISKRWLSEKGLLGDVSNLSKLGMDLLNNIAPVVPKETLIAIERAANGNNGQQFTSRDNPNFIWLTRLLRSLAYDADLFDRCVAILCRFALSEKSNEKSDSIRDLLKSLFWLHLSGTHATAKQRLQIVKKLCESNEASERELGLLLLSSTLEVWHFSSFYSFDFGARPRDYGYEPATYGEISDWYALFITFSTALVISQNSIACDVQNILAEKFRGLWIGSGAFDQLEIMANAIIEINPWSKGWIAIKQTIRLDSKEMPTEFIARLQKLESLLAPRNLLERARTYVFSNSNLYFDLIDVIDDQEDYNKKHKTITKILIQIGKNVVNDQDVFASLLTESVTNNSYQHKLLCFGQGLAAGCSNEHLAIWAKLHQQLSTVEPIQRSYDVLLGFFSELSLTHPDVAQKILDDAVTDDILSECYPSLQFSVEMDQQGLQRLKQSLNNKSLPARLYYGLARCVSDSVDDDSLCDMMKNIASKKDGLGVAITILRDLASNCDKHSHSEIISNLVCDLLVKVNFDQQNNMNNYYLSELIKIYLVSEKSASTAKIICKKLSKKLSHYNSDPHQHWELLKSLAETHPKVCLDIFLDEDEKIYFDELNYKKWLLSDINDETIINWCEINPIIRYPKVVNFITAYQLDEKTEKTNSPELSSLFLTIIDKAPNVIEVLDSFKTTFRPMCWSGSRADIMEKSLSFIIRLKKHENKEVSTWANGEEKLLINEIEWEREREENYNRTRDERFEW
jgi:hypothetical protein